jgi:segregation and condensation protein B
LLRLVEALLFASTEPISEKVLKARLPKGADLPGLLSELAELYSNRGVNLMKIEDRWAFRTASDLAAMLSIERKVNKKLSRAGIETLAIIAYHQPVTRAEIEEIRGVVISKGTLDLLLEIGWIKPAGRRETPGRPVTWATTSAFLEHFGLENATALPGIEELRAAGLLDARAGISTLATQASADGRGVPPDEEDEDERAAAEELHGEPVAAEGGEGEGEAADDDYESALLEKHGEGEEPEGDGPSEAEASSEEGDDEGYEDDDDDYDDADEDDDDDDEDGLEVEESEESDADSSNDKKVAEPGE